MPEDVAKKASATAIEVIRAGKPVLSTRHGDGPKHQLSLPRIAALAIPRESTRRQHQEHQQAQQRRAAAEETKDPGEDSS